MRLIIKLDSPIFNATARRQAFARFVSRQAKDFKNLTKRRMIEGKASGRLYSRRGGAGFSRSHRASARGQRPAPDTMTLVNAVTDQRIDENRSEVFVARRVNPSSRTTADRYAEILQTKLNRPIMSDADAQEASRKMAREGAEVLARLI